MTPYLSILYLENKHDKNPKPSNINWLEFTKAYMCNILRHSGTKYELPALIFNKAQPGRGRTTNGIIAITALVLDIENSRKRPDPYYNENILLGIAQLDRFDYLIHTTFSHTPENPRYRIILPLQKNITVKEYPKCMRFLNALVGPIVDTKSQKPAQIYFIHAIPTGADEKTHFIEHHKGKYLDFDNDTFVTQVSAIISSLGTGRGQQVTDPEIKQAFKNILEFKPWAPEGSRDEMILRVTNSLYHRNPEKFTDEALQAVLFWSHKAIEREAVNPPPTLDNCCEKYQRLWDKDDLARQELHEVKEQLPSPLILQFKKQYYILKPDGTYTRELDEKELIPGAVVRYLSNHPDYSIYTDKGLKSKTKILADLLHLANGIKYDLTATHTKYLPESDMIVNSTINWEVPNALIPAYNEKIDKWITLLGGSDLKKWLAILANLNRLSKTLLIIGEPAIGKTLLAQGCVRRFGAINPVGQDMLTGRFTGALLSCPLIHIDEDIDAKSFERDFLAALRQDLSVLERQVEAKFKEKESVYGALRCMITANHSPFKQQATYNLMDLDAIAERFLPLKPDPSTANYLKTITPDEFEYWKIEGIVKYIKHLEKTIAVPNTTRFGIPTDKKYMSDLLSIAGDMNRKIIEYLIRWITTPKHHAAEYQHIRVYKNELYTTALIIQKHWERYMEGAHKPESAYTITAALRSISDTREYKSTDIGLTKDNDLLFYKVRTNALLLHARDFNVSETLIINNLKEHDQERINP